MELILHPEMWIEKHVEQGILSRICLKDMDFYKEIFTSQKFASVGAYWKFILKLLVIQI